MSQRPDVLVIEARHEVYVPAEGAEIFVTVQGSSLVAGNAAMQKAKEIKQLVEALAQCQLTPDNIALEGVRAEVSSGIITKSSSASYRLRVRCLDLDTLPEILGAITSTKNVKLEQIAWKYPDSAEQQATWLQACIAQANIKAKAAAAALGARIVGVHQLTELGLDAVAREPLPETAFMVSRARTGAVDLGFDLGHRKRAGVKIRVEYRIEGFGEA